MRLELDQIIDELNMRLQERQGIRNKLLLEQAHGSLSEYRKTTIERLV